MKKIIMLFLSLQTLAFTEGAQFKGNHYIASYYDCDSSALSDGKLLKEALFKACEASGLLGMQQASSEAEGDGALHLLLLSESHASIHTYPEQRSCFIDLFICTEGADERLFDKVLTQYLMPGKKKIEVIHRN